MDMARLSAVYAACNASALRHAATQDQASTVGNYALLVLLVRAVAVSYEARSFAKTGSGTDMRETDPKGAAALFFSLSGGTAAERQQREQRLLGNMYGEL